MGKRYVRHDDLCGCERCAVQAERKEPWPVYDCVEDPDIMDCGCSVYRGCDCAEFDDYGDYGEDT